MGLKGKVKKPLDSKRLISSFKYAIEGLKSAYQSEQNLKIHTIAGIFVMFLAFFLQLSSFEFIICLILIGLVLMAELLNTAIEKAVDLVTDEYKPLAKVSKDIAASAVLVISIISFAIGLILFLPKIIPLIGGIL